MDVFDVIADIERSGELRRVRRTIPAELTPQQQERARVAANALASGKVPLPPLRCGHCAGTSLQHTPDRDVICLSCGRTATMKQLRELRRQDIAALIRRFALR